MRSIAASIISIVAVLAPYGVADSQTWEQEFVIWPRSDSEPTPWRDVSGQTGTLYSPARLSWRLHDSMR